jgi:cell shape-determining protein MreD
VFWGVNLGLVVFVIGLIVDTAEIKRIGAPIMGTTLLIALAILAYTALREQLEVSDTDLDPSVRAST